jgi:hypothetical protein
VVDVRDDQIDVVPTFDERDTDIAIPPNKLVVYVYQFERKLHLTCKYWWQVLPVDLG